MRIYLEQGSPEWLEFRRTRIGATDYAVIHREYEGLEQPFKSRDSLLIEKVWGIEKADNNYMLLGRELEPIIHEYCKTIVDASDIEQQVVFNKGTNYGRIASCDAYSQSLNAVFEYKTTSKPVTDFDELVEYYKHQCSHQMFTSDTDKNILIVAFLDKDISNELVYTLNKIAKCIDADELVKLHEKKLILISTVITEFKHVTFNKWDFDYLVWSSNCKAFLDDLEYLNEHKYDAEVLGEKLELIDKNISYFEGLKNDLKNVIVDKKFLKVGNYRVINSTRVTYNYELACINAGIDNLKLAIDYRATAQNNNIDYKQFVIDSNKIVTLRKV